jgi:hypothetical protein
MKKGKSASNLGELSNKIYSLLHNVEPKERARVLSSVTHLFGDSPISANVVSQPQPSIPSAVTPQPHINQGNVTPQQYFRDKAPQNKGEMLAVAAKYREDYRKAQSHTSEDFANFFGEARQNFDRKNFGRDMKNAQSQALLFTKGTPRGQYQLSYHGQQYVDALPDRDAIKNLRKPKGSRRKANIKTSASKTKAPKFR